MTKQKTHTTNYINTFIEVAEDTKTKSGKIPISNNANKKSIATMQYELLFQHPYQYTSDDILFQIFAVRNNIPKTEYKAARKEFFSKGQPCFRCSPLTKTYGFGIHADSEGKMAIYGMETKEYKAFQKDKQLQKIKAMRSSKKNVA